MTLDQFNETHRRLADAGAAEPEGRIHHSCFGDDGELMVYDIWESPALMAGSGAVSGARRVEVRPAGRRAGSNVKWRPSTTRPRCWPASHTSGSLSPSSTLTRARWPRPRTLAGITTGPSPRRCRL